MKDLAGKVAVVTGAGSGIDRGIAHALAEEGTHVCNNAGVFISGPVIETPASDWARMIAVNLMGVVNGLRAFVPRMRAQGASFRVAKNRLAVRALKGTPIEGIAHLFKGPTGIAVSADPVAASKVVAAYAKDNDKLVILGGSVGVTALDANGVKQLATLPSLDELRGKIVGLLVAPATKIAGVVQAPAGQLARVIGAYSSKDAA